MIIDKPIIMTHHFRKRLLTYKIPYWQLFFMLPLAQPSTKPVGERTKYPDNVKHVQYGSYVFTYNRQKDTSPRDLGEIYLMITVFDQKMYLSNKQLEAYDESVRQSAQDYESIPINQEQ